MKRIFFCVLLVLFVLNTVSAREAFLEKDTSSSLTQRAFSYKDTLDEIKIEVYLKEDDPELASRYIEYTKRYLKDFQKLLGPFPYSELNIVETDSPVGVSFPRYILFGSAVIRLPFIVETSLPHEIVHQWFGSSVGVSPEGGNWSEGLATYLADHRMSELKGNGAQYRKGLLLDYFNYRRFGREIPLREFTERTDDLTRAVGYGKSAMVFHMLRKRLGDETFFRALRRFARNYRGKQAAWKDLQRSFEEVSDSSLEDFFYYWINKKGAIELKPEQLSVLYRDGGYLVNLKLKQSGDVTYNFELPLKVITEGGEKDFLINVDSDRIDINLKVDRNPLKIIVDPEYDLFRLPLKDEIPPLISAIKNDPDMVVVYPDREAELYRPLIEYYKKRDIDVYPDSQFRYDALKEHSILILSAENPVARIALDGMVKPVGDFYLKVFQNPLNSDRVIMVIHALSKDTIKRSFYKIGHYGKYTTLAFSEGANILKEVDDSDRGIVFDLQGDFQALRPPEGGNIADVVRSIKDSRVVYIGEDHMNYAHHIIQFEIIRRLYQLNKNIVIGMEMFQRPFQPYLDQYISGEITEKEMLKKTEYFKRWVYDYNLYRDIIQFARAKGIPIIALNIKREIIDKISLKGIDSLDEEERKLLPSEISMESSQYRNYLRQIFSRHRQKEGRSFENFYFSQLIWDETMADSVVKTLDRFPEAQVIVLAGNGHIRNAWGIPSRVKRQRDVSYSIVATASEGGENRFSSGIADFVFYTAWTSPPPSPRLGIFIKKVEGGVMIERVNKNSPAERSGLEEGDLIMAIDGQPVTDIDDLKINLLDKKQGEEVTLRVKKSSLLFDRVEEVKVIL